MRLPIKHIYRAFKELDSYSDEQCRRFVHAATAGARRQVWMYLRVVAVAGPTLGAAIFGIAYVQNEILVRDPTLNLGHPYVTWRGWLLNLGLLAGALAIPPLAGFLTRDWILIRRIRRIVRTRARCGRCHYSLIGLAVGDDLRVICPECGTSTEVDPSLGELTRDPSGAPRYAPHEPPVRTPILFTPHRRRRIRRAAPWVLGALVIIPLILTGSYELFLRWQAGVARSERPAANALLSLIERSQLPRARADEPDAWELFERAQRDMVASDLSVWGPGSKWNPADNRHYPDYGAITYPTPFSDEPNAALRLSQEKYHTTCLALAHEMIEVHRANGLYDTLRTLSNTARYQRSFWSDDDTALSHVIPRPGRDSHSLTKLCAARTRLASDSRDRTEFLDALRSGLGLASLQIRQPTLADYLHGFAAEGLILAQLRGELMRGLPPDWLADIDAVIRAHNADVMHTCWLEGERITSLDAIAYTFAHPEFVRLGPWSPAMEGMEDDDGRLGTYRANRDAVNRVCDTLQTLLSMTIQEQMNVPFPHCAFALVNASAPGSSTMGRLEHRALLHRRGTHAMVAIARFRNDAGDDPVSLESLVPRYLDAVPVDPWNNQPLGYARTDPATDALHRSFLLYSVGADFTDNHGVTSDDSRVRPRILNPPASNETVNLDYVINGPN